MSFRNLNKMNRTKKMPKNKKLNIILAAYSSGKN